MSAGHRTEHLTYQHHGARVLENLTVAQVVKKFFTFYETQVSLACS
jgi:hypothetical protein